jgi:hypothetical protein
MYRGNLIDCILITKVSDTIVARTFIGGGASSLLHAKILLWRSAAGSPKTDKADTSATGHDGVLQANNWPIMRQ